MRILMLVDLFPPFVGGKERYVSELSKGLFTRGHSVSVVTLNVPSYNTPPKECVDGVNVIRISGMYQKIGILYGGSEVRYNLPIKDILLVKQLADIIKELRPEVIVCHGNFLYSVRSLATKLGIPLIVTLHDYIFICPKGNLLFEHLVPCNKQYSARCLKCVTSTSGVVKGVLGYVLYNKNRSVIASVDRYIAVSQAVKDIYLAATGLPDEKISVIYNFYNHHDERALSSECKERFPERFILYVGAFSSQKGVYILLDAFRNIRDRISPDIKLVMIVASREEEISFREEGILTMVNQPRSVVMEAWRRCLFGVVPSIWSEPFGLVVLEAMAEEKAIIASNIGGLKEIVIDNETGLIVPPGNVNALSNAILFLVEHPEVARDLGKKGCSRLLECFSSDVVIEKYESVFKEISR